MPLAAGQKIIITSADGTRRRRLPYAQIQSATARIERYGGWGEFQVSTAIPYAQDALSSVLKGDRVEMYYGGVLRYRGWIEERLRAEGEPDTLAFVGYGLSFLVGQQLCIGRYAYTGSGVDVASAFAEVARDATLSRNQTNPPPVGRQGLALYDALQALEVGTTTTFVDAYDKLFLDVANDLVQKQAGNLAVWGGDADAFGQNRLYCRPLAPTTFPPTHTIRVPALNTDAAQAEDQAGDLKNRTLMTGGQPRFPQMLHNGGFDLPTVFQTGDSGLITDGDFEGRTWSLGGGASYKDAGHQEGQPFSGNWMVEMDHVGETADKSGSFATTPTAGHNYVFSVRAKKEVGLQTADGSGSLTIKNGSGTTLLTVPLSVAPAGTAWDYFSATFSMPAGAAQWSAHFECDHISAYAGDQGGLLIDAASLEDASVLYQDGWQVETFGSAAFSALNWVYKDVAFDGLYCVYLSPRCADANGQDCQLVPLNTARIPLAFKQTLRLSYRYRSPLGAALGLPKIQLQLEWHKSDGSYDSTSSVTINGAAASASWQYAEIVASAPSDATSVLPIVNPRGNGDILIDCVSVQDAEAVAAGDVPVAADGHPGYQPEGPVTAYVTAAGAGLGAGSEAAYGTRVETTTEGSLNTLAGLTQVAGARLAAKSVPLTRPSVTRKEDPTVYWPGDSLSLQGLHGPLLSGGQILTIAAVALTFGDLFTCALEIGREAPDESLVEKQLILDQIQRNGPGAAAGAGGSGAGYSSGTNFGGGTTGGGVTVTDGTNTVSASSTLRFVGATVAADTAQGTVDITGVGFTPAAAAAPAAVGFDHADYAGAAEYVTWRANVSAAPAGGAIEFFGWQTSPDGAAWAAEAFSGYDFQGPGFTSGSQYSRCRAYPLAASGVTPAPSAWVASAAQAYAAPASSAPFAVVPALPAASAATRGLGYLLAATGTADAPYVGIQKADGTFGFLGVGGGAIVGSKNKANGSTYAAGLARWLCNDTGATLADSVSTPTNDLTINAAGRMASDVYGQYFGPAGTSYAQGSACVVPAGDFSVEAFVQTGGTPSAFRCIASQGSDTGNNATLLFELAMNSGAFGFWLGSGASEVQTNGGTPLANTLYHLVGTYVASTRVATLYVNGASVGTTTLGAARNAPATAKTNLGTGDGRGAGNAWDGHIYFASLYARALPSAEVAARYTAIG